MARLSSFMSVSVDGCYADRNGDMSWAHRDDAEMRAFTAENAKGGGMLVFGRLTYQMMEAYWPTPLAAKNEPAVAKSINELPKIVFSKTLERAAWSNTTLVRGDLRAAVDAVRLSRSTLRTIRGNLFWAFAYNVAALPLAAAGLLNPMIAGAAMAASSASVASTRLIRGIAPMPFRAVRMMKSGARPIRSCSFA